MLLAAVANGLVTTMPDGVRAEITLNDVASPEPFRTAQAVVRITPATAVDQPSWLTVISWQGDGLHVDRLVPVGDGSYRTTAARPVGGSVREVARAP